MKNTEEKTKHTSAPELEDEDLDEEDEDDLDEDDDDDKDRYGFDLSPNGDDDRYATARGWEPPNKYKKLLDKYRKEHPLEHFHESIFVRESLNSVFTADTCAEPTQQLFGDLVRTGELTILFADTGVGKSILAVQIGDAVARGKSVLSEPGTIAAGSLASENSQFATLNSQLPKNDSPARPVVYIDFEMTRSQVAERYSAGIKKGKYLHRYRFRNMERLCLEWDDELPTGFTSLADFIGFSVWEEVKKKKVGLLIIDNISYLTSGQGAKEALVLMKSLKALKDEYGLAILVLAHTPKRSFAKHLSINDLAGRKELSNFIDNSFAIGRSHLRPDLRYIKQMKQRNRPETFGDDNVILCRLEKPNNFPKFTFLECTGERQHLLRPYDLSASEAGTRPVGSVPSRDATITRTPPRLLSRRGAFGSRRSGNCRVPGRHTPYRSCFRL